MFFSGEVNAVVDANGRVSLPSMFRDGLPEDEKRFVLLIGEKNSLVLYRMSDFEEFEAPKLKSMDSDKRGTAMRNAQPVILDEKQNRFLLPKKFKEHAKIDKDVVFLGDLTKIRIYAADVYAAQNFGEYEYAL